MIQYISKHYSLFKTCFVHQREEKKNGGEEGWMVCGGGEVGAGPKHTFNLKILF